MTDQILSQHSSSGERPAHDTGTGGRGEGDPSLDPRLVAAARRAAVDGAVLLRNDPVPASGSVASGRGGEDAPDGADAASAPLLPLAPGTRVALFGRVQHDWIAVGYGSGGDVNAPYVTTLVDSLDDADGVEIDQELAALYRRWCAEHPIDQGEWGQWPFSYPEMELDDATVAAAAERSDVAIVVVGRAAGEDRENTLTEGSYFLTVEEKRMLAQVTSAFERVVVVVATGNVMDLAWAGDPCIGSVLLAWLGGMEGARAIADVLTGTAEPGGRLTSTIARRYEDYPGSDHFGDAEANDYVEDIFVGYRYFETFAPDAVLHPFGSGLGYTTFAIDARLDGDLAAGTATVRATVRNTGDRPGREVVQVYAAAPIGQLPHPARVLVGSARTGTIEPGASTDVTIAIPRERIASYDDSGATGHRSAWVIEPGEYAIHVGHDVRQAPPIGRSEVAELIVVEQLEEAAAPDPAHPFQRMTIERDEDGSARIGWEDVPLATVDLRERILARLPEEIGGGVADGAASDGASAVGAAAGASSATGDAPSFTDVLAGRADLDAFIASLTPAQLARLAYGDTTMDSPLGAKGNAGALGGVSEDLRALGVPPAITTDGPSGIRIAAYASLLPCGTALASSWDPEAVRELASLHAQEMRAKGSDILLAPGMNIHRNPLCGRNFEYFSEDPLVTGTIASAVVDGVQSQGVAACPKHFAANNQETARTRADSRVSERALREIYLRGFEQVIKGARPLVLMTSYNRVNGVWAHYHYDLVTTILRGQWGYDGLVVTDWWMQMAPDPLFPALCDSGYRVRAQVDVLMPGGAVHFGTERDTGALDGYETEDGLTLGELQRGARNVLTALVRLGEVLDRPLPEPR